MKIIRIEQVPNSPMHLTWIINNICPNSCSYCPESLHSGSNHHYDWNNAKLFFKLLIEKYPKIHCSVSGGEPSISPFFKEIVKTFYDSGNTIGITSNAAKPVEYWEDISHYLNYICFSYHPEFPDRLFLEKVKAAGKHTPVTVRIMMHPHYWSHCVEKYYEFSKIDFINTESVKILPMSDIDNSVHEYSQSQLEWLSLHEGTKRHLAHIPPNKFVPDINSIIHLENGTIDTDPNTVDYINKNMTRFYGYRCMVGLKSLFVDSYGEIYLANCLINGSIGNINDPSNIKWPTQSVICNKDLCQCTTDVNIEKISYDPIY